MSHLNSSALDSPSPAFTSVHLNTIIVQPAANRRRPHSATLIFFHGLGDHADNLVQWLRYLLGRDFAATARLAHIKCLYPTAPRQRFTIFGGRQANVWFDVWGRQANIALPERREAFGGIDAALGELIDAEVRAGIPLQRIVVGGFSMGGYIALHAGLRIRPGLAGVFGLSTYLCHDTAVFDALEERRRRRRTEEQDTDADLLMMHGDGDDLLEHAWGRTTFGELRRLGVRGEWRTVPGMKHEMRGSELLALERWLEERLPAGSADVVHKL